MGNKGEGPGSGVAETAAQIVAHTTLEGSLISIASGYMYYKTTSMWFSLIGSATGDSASAAAGAIDEMNETSKEVGKSSKRAGNKIGKNLK